MSPDPAEVLKLASDLVTAKKSLEILQRRWDALFPEDKGTNKVGRKRSPNGISSQVLAIFTESPGMHFDATHIAQRLNIERKPVERSLNNLFVAGKIVRASRGQYHLKIEGGRET